MKKLISSLCMMLLVITFATSGVNNDNQIIGIATGAIKSTCDNAAGDLQANVKTVGICFVEGFLKEVTFYRVPNCPPNQACIQVIQVVGSVTLDCENNVIGVTCGPPIISL